MRYIPAVIALAAAGFVVTAAPSASAATIRISGTVAPGTETFLTPELTPTTPYRGVVLVQLSDNPGPVEIKIGNCRGRYLGTVAIPAGDHAPHVAAVTGAPPTCIRYRVRNTGTAPVTLTGTGYF
ncbi:hypothetical protein ABGB17_30215 [Sphaerisporangium sp. B11E5]|uniref:hypothetical protein n=1 Tax=Sphaerisporangium sp. B11E5 TaxID=3153563 RepID=UPI00325CDF18